MKKLTVLNRVNKHWRNLVPEKAGHGTGCTRRGACLRDEMGAPSTRHGEAHSVGKDTGRPVSLETLRRRRCVLLHGPSLKCQVRSSVEGVLDL